MEINELSMIKQRIGIGIKEKDGQKHVEQLVNESGRCGGQGFLNRSVSPLDPRGPHFCILLLLFFFFFFFFFIKSMFKIGPRRHWPPYTAGSHLLLFDNHYCRMDNC